MPNGFIEVELPDGEIVEFPEGTSDDVMKSVMKREWNRKQIIASGEENARKLSEDPRGLVQNMRAGAEEMRERHGVLAEGPLASVELAGGIASGVGKMVEPFWHGVKEAPGVAYRGLLRNIMGDLDPSSPGPGMLRAALSSATSASEERSEANQKVHEERQRVLDTPLTGEGGATRAIKTAGEAAPIVAGVAAAPEAMLAGAVTSAALAPLAEASIEPISELTGEDPENVAEVVPPLVELPAFVLGAKGGHKFIQPKVRARVNSYLEGSAKKAAKNAEIKAAEGAHDPALVEVDLATRKGRNAEQKRLRQEREAAGEELLDPEVEAQIAKDVPPLPVGHKIAASMTGRIGGHVIGGLSGDPLFVGWLLASEGRRLALKGATKRWTKKKSAEMRRQYREETGREAKPTPIDPSMTTTESFSATPAEPLRPGTITQGAAADTMSAVGTPVLEADIVSLMSRNKGVTRELAIELLQREAAAKTAAEAPPQVPGIPASERTVIDSIPPVSKTPVEAPPVEAPPAIKGPTAPRKKAMPKGRGANKAKDLKDAEAKLKTAKKQAAKAKKDNDGPARAKAEGLVAKRQAEVKEFRQAEAKQKKLDERIAVAKKDAKANPVEPAKNQAEVDAAAEAALAAERGTTAKRSKDFETEGTYDVVTKDGKKGQIHRDPENGWWYEVDSGKQQTHHMERFLGFNKKEALAAFEAKKAPPKKPVQSKAPSKESGQAEVVYEFKQSKSGKKVVVYRNGKKTQSFDKVKGKGGAEEYIERQKANDIGSAPKKTEGPRIAQAEPRKTKRNKEGHEVPHKDDYTPVKTEGAKRASLPVRPQQTKLTRTETGSKGVPSYAYDEAGRVLELQHKDGRVYRYYGVEKGAVDAALAAESKGKAFGELERGHRKAGGRVTREPDFVAETPKTEPPKPPTKPKKSKAKKPADAKPSKTKEELIAKRAAEEANAAKKAAEAKAKGKADAEREAAKEGGKPPVKKTGSLGGVTGKGILQDTITKPTKAPAPPKKAGKVFKADPTKKAPVAAAPSKTKPASVEGMKTHKDPAKIGDIVNKNGRQMKVEGVDSKGIPNELSKVKEQLDIPEAKGKANPNDPFDPRTPIDPPTKDPLPKSLEPYREYISDYSPPMQGDPHFVGIRVATDTAAGYAAPTTLSETSVASIVSQLRKVKKEIGKIPEGAKTRAEWLKSKERLDVPKKSGKTTKSSLGIEDVEALTPEFKGKVRAVLDPKGKPSLVVETDAGTVYIRPNHSISFTTKAAEAQGLTRAQVKARGGPSGKAFMLDGKAFIELKRKGALPHEFYHIAEKIFLTNKAIKVVRNAFEKKKAAWEKKNPGKKRDISEFAADGYRDWFNADAAFRAKMSNTVLGRFYMKIHAFALNVVDKVFTTKGKTFRELKSGKSIAEAGAAARKVGISTPGLQGKAGNALKKKK